MRTYQLLNLIPSGDTPRGISQSAAFLRALRTLECSLSLELVQRAQHSALRLVATTESIPLVLMQARRHFPGAELTIESLAHDPALTLPSETVAGCELRLGASPHLPLQTFDDDLEMLDPLPGLCSLTDELAHGERVVAQIMISPAANWPPKESVRARQPEPQPNNPAMFLFCGGGLLLSAVILILTHDPNFIGYLCVVGLLAVLCAWIYWYLENRPFPFQLDPELVEEKLNDVGFLTTIRLLAFSPSAERAAQLLKSLAAGYGQFNRGRGNHFVTNPLCNLDAPRAPEPVPFWKPKPILNAAELAGLWHLPLRIADLPDLASAMHRPARPPRGVAR